MNRRAQYEAMLTNALFDDPEDFVSKLTARQLKALKAEIKAELESFKTEFKPVQEHVAMTKAELETREFESKNREKLFAGDTLSPVGQLTNTLWINAQNSGAPMAWDMALKIAEASIPALPVNPISPAAPTNQSNSQINLTPASQSISKAGNKRFKDTLSAQSRVVNRVEAQEQEFEAPTWKQLENQFASKFGLKN
jgi:hypothetical protein